MDAGSQHLEMTDEERTRQRLYVAITVPVAIYVLLMLLVIIGACCIPKRNVKKSKKTKNNKSKRSNFADLEETNGVFVNPIHIEDESGDEQVNKGFHDEQSMEAKEEKYINETINSSKDSMKRTSVSEVTSQKSMKDVLENHNDASPTISTEDSISTPSEEKTSFTGLRNGENDDHEMSTSELKSVEESDSVINPENQYNVYSQLNESSYASINEFGADSVNAQDEELHDVRFTGSLSNSQNIDIIDEESNIEDLYSGVEKKVKDKTLESSIRDSESYDALSIEDNRDDIYSNSTIPPIMSSTGLDHSSNINSDDVLSNRSLTPPHTPLSSLLPPEAPPPPLLDSHPSLEFSREGSIPSSPIRVTPSPPIASHTSSATKNSVMEISQSVHSDSEKISSNQPSTNVNSEESRTSKRVEHWSQNNPLHSDEDATIDVNVKELLKRFQ